MALKKSLVAVFIFLSACAGANSPLPAPPSGEKEVVYLLHGLGRSRPAMWVLASRLEAAGFSVSNIGYSSITETPEEILRDISGQIRNSLPKDNRTVHFVGHSLGGLMIRAFLESAKVNHLGRVVLIGTPNRGTAVIDSYRDSWWMQLAGPTALALSTDKKSFPNSLAAPYYPVGIIAGISGDSDNEDVLPGPDDGLVPLESTKVSGMTDMVIIPSSHWMLRYNEEAARQTIAFLRTGRFEKTKDIN